MLGAWEGDLTPRPSGDGAVDATDVVQVRRFAAGIDPLTVGSNEGQRADSAPLTTSGDGVINSGDVIQARRFAAGLDPLNPAGGTNMRPSVETLAAAIGGSLLGKTFGSVDLLRIGASKEGRSSVELGADAAGVSFTITYDESRYGKPTVQLGKTAAGAVLTVNDTVPGRLTILVDSMQSLRGGQLVEIAFAGGEGSISLVGTPSLADALGNDISFSKNRF